MKRTRYVFLIFWVISLLSFIPSIGAGFVYDFLGWQKTYNEGSFSDILHSFGYYGNHQFLHFVFYSFYKLFHIRGLPWYLFFCSLHAVNGYLFYLLILRLMKQWGGSISPLLAVLGVTAFLIHPYSVEAVVWKACVHYLISLMAILLILILFLRYMESGDKRNLLSGGIIYTVSLFTLEISFITPLAVLFAGLMTWLTNGSVEKPMKRIIYFCGTLWTLLGGYLLLNIISLGSVVGHYGAKVHLRFDLISIVSTEMKYLAKHLAYARFYPQKVKTLLFDQILSLPEIAFLGIIILLAVILLHFIKFKKLKAEWHVAFFGVFTSLLFVLPIANIYFFHLHIGMNDRFSYIPMAFLILAFIAVLSSRPSWLGYAVIGILLVINIFLQQKTLKYWHQSAEVLSALKKDFRWHDAPYVFVLNSPDNLNGIFMASVIDEPSGIDELIDYQTLRSYDGAMFDIFQYNMTTPTDGVKVEQVGPMQLKVTFNQWGNWWHHNGIGATTYENEFYKAELLDYPYLLTFKQFPEGSVILYQDGFKWKEIKFEKSN